MSIVQTDAATAGRRAASVASSTFVEATIGLVAGRGVAGYLGDGGPATLAQLNGPTGVAVDAAGGILVVDASNRVRRIAYGTITTIAGSGVPGQVSQGLPLPEDGGPALDAQMNDPIGVAIDRDGNILIADALYHRIRRVTPEGTITTIAGNGIPSFLGDGGPATAANLQYPTGVALDHDGNLFIADAANHRIRRIDPDGTITTVAGTGGAGFAGDGGPATEATLHKPTGVAVSRKGELFIADEYNHRIRRVGPHGRISTIAGATEFPPNYDGLVPGDYGGDGGPATEAFLNFPTEVLLDGDQNVLIADSSNYRVRSVDRDGIITTIAGGGSEPPADGLPATSASLAGGPTGMAFDGAGDLLVCEERGHRVWRLTGTNG
jgi:DNA-binding beta-propeller fold protein YncE